jgi:hypothetical protein
MTSIRKLHIYLGCAFAPLLMFFVLSGSLQTFELHEGRKEGSYSPPGWLAAAGSVHTHQRMPAKEKKDASSRTPMRIVFTLTCVGLFATTTLGLVMAWSLKKHRRGVVLSLIAGVAIPIITILIQSQLR